MLYVIRVAWYNRGVIRSFADKDTENLFNRIRVKRFQSVEDAGRRALLRLDAATSLDDLRAVPGNRLEKVPEFGADVYSIRANDQYRVVFKWDAGYALEARLTDHYR